MLLLDEPTNHLDAESVAWLERYLAEFGGTIVAITHDRYFLDNVAEWILELDRGEGIPWKGNYSSWLEQKRERLRVEKKQASARQSTLERELEWIRMAPRLGNDVVLCESVRKGYGDILLVEDLSFSLPPGAIVGIIGPNGAGKTTLFRMITGRERPDDGTVRLGQTVRLAYVDQSGTDLDPDKTVFEEVAQGLEVLQFGRVEVNPRAYLSWFNFRGVDQQKKVGVLSGAENTIGCAWPGF